ncbi:MAG: glutamate--tRNA ligase [Proteobacteria bacterium]|nr:glutamate--tRNA ligase [Pseudomonadota bacterium]
MQDVRTRFAPSPTGFLHIGGARTALFNWAYARRHAGSLVLRIEDTDRERSTAESEAAVLEGLAWLGVDWDDGPYRQSERSELYAEAADRLLASGRAYRCACTREELEARKQATIAAGRKWIYDGRCRDRELGPDCGEHTVRLRVDDDEQLEWDDLVFGPSGQQGREVGDKIIRRSDGSVLYHLAVVVDDLEMSIRQVIRGVDHLPNTPFQIALYRALDAEPPRFAHLPLIVNEKGVKLSKRRDPVSVQQFREDGFLPEAVRNWLIRIGWSHGDQEIFSREEIVQLFDLESVGRSSGQADPAKLEALNRHYIVSIPAPELHRAARPFLAREAGYGDGDGPTASPELERLLDLLRERSVRLTEMAARARWFLLDEITVDEKAARKHLTPAALPILEVLRDRLESVSVSNWEDASLEEVFETVKTEQGDVSMGVLAQPVRVAVTGSAASPGIYETLAVLGRERTLERLGSAIERIRSGR